MQRQPDTRSLLLRFRAFTVSLPVMLTGFAGGKYALFRYLEQLRRPDVFVMCYIITTVPPRWNMLDALPSLLEALAIILLAGLVGALVPRKWLGAGKTGARKPTAVQASEARQRLMQQLIDEERFPDGVARQLKDS